MNLPKGLRRIVIGHTLELFIDSTESIVFGRAEKAIRKGESVTWEDGTKEWETHFILHDKTKTGSAAYTWKGDLVKAEVYRVRKTRDGKISRKFTGTKYVSWED